MNILVEYKITFPTPGDLKKTYTPKSILNKIHIVLYYIFYSLDILNGQVHFLSLSEVQLYPVVCMDTVTIFLQKLPFCASEIS